MFTRFIYDVKLETKTANPKSHTFASIQVESYKSPHLEKSTAIEITSEFIEKMFDQPSSVLCTISVLRKPVVSADKLISPPRTLEKLEALNEEILSEIECPVCFEYLIPPIFQCVLGHSICEKCKSQVPECPSCKGAINETRNVTLEKITERVNYHCKYWEFDCRHVANSR